MKHLKGALSICGLLVAPLCAASPVTMTKDLNNYMEVRFSAVSQPATHNAIQFNPTTLTYPSTTNLQARISLFDEAGLLGTGVIGNQFVGGRFTDPSSFFSGSSISVDIDFGRIADGVTDGLFVFEILGGPTTGSYSFDTNDIVGRTFGDSGGSPAFFPTISSVTVSTVSPVPEPETYALLLAGLGVLGFAARRRKLKLAA